MLGLSALRHSKSRAGSSADQAALQIRQSKERLTQFACVFEIGLSTLNSNSCLLDARDHFFSSAFTRKVLLIDFPGGMNLAGLTSSSMHRMLSLVTLARSRPLRRRNQQAQRVFDQALEEMSNDRGNHREG